MTSSSPDGSPLTPDSAPGLSEILGYFQGTIELMQGRSEGLRRLDLSADGFWSSFFALFVALPPMALSWIEFEDVQREAPVADAGPVFVFGAHAAADILAWLLPVALLMALAKWIGLRRKLAPLVVASNWGNACLAWAMAPAELLVIVTGGHSLAMIVAVIASLVALGLLVRLIATALGHDMKAAIGITILMILASMFSYAAMTDLTGLQLI
ncbi:hypothetical protein GCM10011390_31220 [Aureimonas endophytica]|uniref:Uncharacterized protein n=1 Tax=Aureimonas endophytica TaxID=2027858 RepID=A0A916ZRV0_9HYPH|nr:hypothetical protein [Aureimonas endophytica]GGE09908.1 hypothetical protein GCM10011390_31220 [Aureimonas endophytica]